MWRDKEMLVLFWKSVRPDLCSSLPDKAKENRWKIARNSTLRVAIRAEVRDRLILIVREYSGIASSIN